MGVRFSERSCVAEIRPIFVSIHYKYAFHNVLTTCIYITTSYILHGMWNFKALKTVLDERLTTRMGV